jgi:hypothetical protein
MARSACSLCSWRSREWPTRDQAGFEATWHVYEKHREHWRALFGDRPPTDPDPRSQ